MSQNITFFMVELISVRLLRHRASLERAHRIEGNYRRVRSLLRENAGVRRGFRGDDRRVSDAGAVRRGDSGSCGRDGAGGVRGVPAALCGGAEREPAPLQPGGRAGEDRGRPLPGGSGRARAPPRCGTRPRRRRSPRTRSRPWRTSLRSSARLRPPEGRLRDTHLDAVSFLRHGRGFAETAAPPVPARHFSSSRSSSAARPSARFDPRVHRLPEQGKHPPGGCGFA